MTPEQTAFVIVEVVILVIVGFFLIIAYIVNGSKENAVESMENIIRKTIKDSFTAWQRHLADRELLSCISRCSKRVIPEEYIKGRLCDIGVKEMWRQVHEEAGVEEGEESLCDTCQKGICIGRSSLPQPAVTRCEGYLMEPSPNESTETAGTEDKDKNEEEPDSFGANKSIEKEETITITSEGTTQSYPITLSSKGIITTEEGYMLSCDFSTDKVPAEITSFDDEPYRSLEQAVTKSNKEAAESVNDDGKEKFKGWT